MNDTTASSGEKKRSQGRPRAFEMADVLDQAVLVFRERGYANASIDVLKSATGLTAGSIYKAFRDKKHIFAAAFDRYVESRQAQLSERLGDRATGRERIAEVLRFYLDSASGAEGRRGCLVLASLIETSTLNSEPRAAVERTLARNRAGLVGMLHAGKEDGSIRSDLPVESCADLLLNLLQGLRAVGKLHDPADHDTLIELALKILN